MFGSNTDYMQNTWMEILFEIRVHPKMNIQSFFTYNSGEIST